ncbi:MAG: MarR family transcriptional regulator [Bacteroidota bacterium]
MEQEIMEILYNLKKRFIAIDEEFISDLDLTPAEYYTFIAISNCSEINSTQLSQKMGLSLSRISRVVDKMVVKGFLTRDVSNNDRRSIDLKLTTKGNNYLDRIMEFRTNCESRIINNIPKEELELIRKSLKKVLELL